MPQLPENPGQLNAACSESADNSEAETAPSVTHSEIRDLRQEKLAAIRQAVENGAYDSDELLEKALARMLQKLDRTDDSSGILP